MSIPVEGEIACPEWLSFQSSKPYMHSRWVFLPGSECCCTAVPARKLVNTLRLPWQADAKMLTPLGDQCVHLWDTASAQGLGQLWGHNGSIGSVFMVYCIACE